MNELKKMKNLFDDFMKEADKFVSKQKKQRIEQVSEKIIYWGETAEKDMPWEDSRDWCEEKGGRLPTLEELEKAYKDGVSGFNPKGRYWSSTPYNNYAYYVRFSDCYSVGYLTYDTYSVRCVYDK
jgi:hypothetical protein